MRLASEVQLCSYRVASGNSEQVCRPNDVIFLISYQGVNVKDEMYVIAMCTIVEKEENIVVNEIDNGVELKLNLLSKYQQQGGHTAADVHRMKSGRKILNKF